MKHILELRSVTKIYGDAEASVCALRQANLEVGSGTFLAITGPSGSGKSTMLNLLGGIESPTEGAVYVEGVDIAAMDDAARTRMRRRRIGIIFQSFNLLNELSVSENVTLPLRLDGVPYRAANEKARAMLARVGLAGKAGRIPAQLSGGEQQRVAIARALAIDPVAILADEPTGSLDSENSAMVMDLLTEQVKQYGHTLVVVTHDMAIARWADSSVVVRDGRVNPVQARTLVEGAR